jgi:hypothetical protein
MCCSPCSRNVTLLAHAVATAFFLANIVRPCVPAFFESLYMYVASGVVLVGVAVDWFAASFQPR